MKIISSDTMTIFSDIAIPEENTIEVGNQFKEVMNVVEGSWKVRTSSLLPRLILENVTKP